MMIRISYSFRILSLFSLASLGLLASCAQNSEPANIVETLVSKTEKPAAPRTESPLQVGLLSSISPSAAGFGEIETLLVRIFPHQGRYVSPHGREKIIHEVGFHSEKPCSLFKGSKLISTKSTFEFNAAVMKSALILECSSPVFLIREKGLTSHSYQGRFIISKKLNDDGKPFVQVLQEIEFEDYLKGVVPSEMPGSWNVEALKAQAVAARTYAVYQLLNQVGVENHEADVDDTVSYQAYTGLTLQHKNSNEAVEATRGIIMTYEGKVIKSFFSSDAGGHTESAKNLWGMDLDYSTAKKEPFNSKFISTWTLKKSVKDLQTKLGLKFISIEVAKNLHSSGRVKKITLHLKSKSGKDITRSMNVDQFAAALDLKSTLFTITKSKDGQYLIQGQGYGHGVGMSQHGARVLAREMHWNYQDILKFYFDGIELYEKPHSID